VGTQTTDSNGNYLFGQLRPGSYTVVVTALGNLRQTYDLDGVSSANAAAFTLAAGADRRDVDFGYRVPPVASLGDRVWLDTDGDGSQDASEAGIPGVTVTLRDSSGSVISTATTDTDGNYRFNSLEAGNYDVTVTSLPLGLAPTYDLDGVSSASKATVSLAEGVSRVDVDFGFKSVALAFTTYTQGGWGAKANGSNPGAFLLANFPTVFPAGVAVGGGYTLKFTSASAITVFLPQGGTASVLTASATNPTSSTAGVLAGQVLSMQLSLSCSNAGVTRYGLGNLKLQSGKFAGYTLASFCRLANKVLGGDTSCLPSGATIADVNDAATKVNENFDNGTTDKGFLR
jgi:hypothetical protein